MPYIILLSLAVLLLVFLFFLFFYLNTAKKKKKDFAAGQGETAFTLIKQDLEEIRREIERTREKNMEILQDQLRQSSTVVKDVTVQLEKMHSDHRQVIDLKTGLEKLTNVLANPKQRGILGEYFLETLLKNVFPPDRYKCQYKFEDGETVDAVIFIDGKKIPIDSKFSLENYNRILDEKNDEARKELEKKFKQDLKNRIEETAKYIRPQEGTTDFAFMFIPSEGIYYDLLVNKIGGIKSATYDLIEYAFTKKNVVIASPTSFYAYLQTVLHGLRALKIEKSAGQIKKRVESLQRHLTEYDSWMKKLGKGIDMLANMYEKAYKEFIKIDKDIVRIAGANGEVKSVPNEKDR